MRTLYRMRMPAMEAAQFNDTPAELVAMSDLCDREIRIDYSVPTRPRLRVRSLDGVKVADIGDWIVRGARGEFIVVPRVLFRDFCEPVVES